jgi:hypothetical protein
LNYWILNKYDYGPKRQIQDAVGSSMHNIIAMEKRAKRLTVNREPLNLEPVKLRKTFITVTGGLPFG